MGSLWGAGVYGLSEVGRSRFGPYPYITADDLYVDQCFKRSEIEIVGSAAVQVTAPRRTTDLLRILRRNYQGKAENNGLPSVPGSTTMSTVRDLARAHSVGAGREFKGRVRWRQSALSHRVDRSVTVRFGVMLSAADISRALPTKRTGLIAIRNYGRYSCIALGSLRCMKVLARP
jgi:hypothetical protein